MNTSINNKIKIGLIITTIILLTILPFLNYSEDEPSKEGSVKTTAQNSQDGKISNKSANSPSDETQNDLKKNELSDDEDIWTQKWSEQDTSTFEERNFLEEIFLKSKITTTSTTDASSTESQSIEGSSTEDITATGKEDEKVQKTSGTDDEKGELEYIVPQKPVRQLDFSVKCLEKLESDFNYVLQNYQLSGTDYEDIYKVIKTKVTDAVSKWKKDGSMHLYDNEYYSLAMEILPYFSSKNLFCSGYSEDDSLKVSPIVSKMRSKFAVISKEKAREMIWWLLGIDIDSNFTVQTKTDELSILQSYLNCREGELMYLPTGDWLDYFPQVQTEGFMIFRQKMPTYGGGASGYPKRSTSTYHPLVLNDGTQNKSNANVQGDTFKQIPLNASSSNAVKSAVDKIENSEEVNKFIDAGKEELIKEKTDEIKEMIKTESSDSSSKIQDTVKEKVEDLKVEKEK